MLEDKLWKRLAGWVTPVLGDGVKILVSRFQRRCISPIVTGISGIGTLDGEVPLAAISMSVSSHQELMGNSKNTWMQETWSYLKCLLDQSGTRLCVLNTNESVCFLFEFSVFVLEDWMNKVINLTSRLPWGIFFILICIYALLLFYPPFLLQANGIFSDQS